MSAIIGFVSDMVTAAVGWVGSFAGLFTASADGALSNPILLVPICLTVAGFGVGILKRLMRVE